MYSNIYNYINILFNINNNLLKGIIIINDQNIIDLIKIYIYDNVM